ncbi:MAG: hypothetical protein U0872_01205 [Planctomycetaceae bacterium]
MSAGAPEQEAEISSALERRNGLVFLACNCLTFLIAPVTYVGLLHAAILNSLEASHAVANLPEAVYHYVTPLPMLIAWLWPSPRLLRPFLSGSLIIKGAAGAFVALLFVTAPRTWWIPALILHPAIIGVTAGVQDMCLWELIGRGMSEKYRSRILGWTFGIGPLFAVAGSCATQLVLNGDFIGLVHMTPLRQPWNYAVLFGATCVAMWLSAALVLFIRVPTAAHTSTAVSFPAVFQGLRAYFLNSIIAVAAVGFLLTHSGIMILNNVSLYAEEALGRSPEDYAGVQLALRFSCKCIAGFALGWIATRWQAKSALLATTGLCLAGVTWALLIPGPWYLFSFGLLGAGELFYVYYLNYIVGCSAPERIRENSALTNMLTVAIGIVPWIYGALSDRDGHQASFLLAISLLGIAWALVYWRLPATCIRADVSRQ